MPKLWKLATLLFLIVVIIQVGVAQQQYPSAKLYAAHSNGDTEDCFSAGEEVYVKGKDWPPNGEVRYIITDSGKDWKKLIECYRGTQTACDDLNLADSNEVPVLKEGTVTANSEGKVSTVYIEWIIPDPTKHYRLLAWNEFHWDPQDGDAGSNDSFGCREEIPEFPFILLPVGIILGFFYLRKR